MTHLTKRQRRELAESSLRGLSVGDAFGERFFGDPARVDGQIRDRVLPPGPWPVTDDTVMAMSIVDVLCQCATIDCDRLARYFGTRYRLDPARGYGATAHGILTRLAAGDPWRDVSRSVFGGLGSMGNGGAMRAAPIGAYFAGDFGRAAEEADRSAAVTHAHPEGRAGAIAVAIAAAWVATGNIEVDSLFEITLKYTPSGETRDGIERARELPPNCDVHRAVSALGNGSRVSAQDTVPFALWCATRKLDSYGEALWLTVSGLGNRDTTCAIVGGILASNLACVIPTAWLEAREPLTSLPRVD
ncbi:MAG: ADP-ribosylglycohydrolase family protein [Polyangiaceae bacterium]